MTGRLCPALCEFSCVLGCNDSAVTIRENELGLIEYAFDKKIIKPHPPKKRTGKKVAVVGSGPAGLACAAELNKQGHLVTVFERDEKVGGILRFGIPDFKLEKNIIDRRVDIYKKEGIEFKSGVCVGKDYKSQDLLKNFDAVALCLGSRQPRDLKIEGRELSGVHFAMDYLMQNNRRVAGQKIASQDLIDAKGKKVVVIGGGDTGADCVGTANRQGASCVVQIELMPQPPEKRPEDQPWPKYPLILKTSTSHEEGGERHWCVSTKKFTGTAGQLKKLVCVRVDVSFDAAKRMVVKELPGKQFEIEADLVLLAMGFLHPEHEGLVKDLGLTLDERGNIKTGADYMSSQKGIFAAGDARRGQSLVVWAIAEGQNAAESINRYLSK
jgi:glutamate synthase (NADPH/NADH) small chain